MIVSTLLFSELPTQQQSFVLDACRTLLSPHGKLLIADEVVPKGNLKRILFHLIRSPLAFLTWLLTRTTTSALEGFEQSLAESGFEANRAASLLGGTLVLFEGWPRQEPSLLHQLPAAGVGRLDGRATLRTLVSAA
jgi:demethylmenaquinone methyltransferase/2-methoxy-6-polyprenyl-1,4-benzoquinol methylase